MSARIEAAARVLAGAGSDEHVGGAWLHCAESALGAADDADDHVRIKLDDDTIEAIRQVVDDETMNRTGRSVGDLASGHVAAAVAELLRARAGRIE